MSKIVLTRQGVRDLSFLAGKSKGRTMESYITNV